MDSNAHVGTLRADADINEPTGPYRPQLTSWAGVQLEALLRENRLALANTWIPAVAGPTWTDGIHFSRIDYIALPKSYLPNIVRMEVAYQDARLLQASTCVNWRDHAPVKLTLLYGDWHPDKEEKPARWDK
eukprot:2281115-Heterocapsa_arctica.AAC.1